MFILKSIKKYRYRYDSSVNNVKIYTEREKIEFVAKDSMTGEIFQEL